jgi:hypothetical protein
VRFCRIAIAAVWMLSAPSGARRCALSNRPLLASAMKLDESAGVGGLHAHEARAPRGTHAGSPRVSMASPLLVARRSYTRPATAWSNASVS